MIVLRRAMQCGIATIGVASDSNDCRQITLRGRCMKMLTGSPSSVWGGLRTICRQSCSSELQLYPLIVERTASRPAFYAHPQRAVFLIPVYPRALARPPALCLPGMQLFKYVVQQFSWSSPDLHDHHFFISQTPSISFFTAPTPPSTASFVTNNGSSPCPSDSSLPSILTFALTFSIASK